MVEPTHAIWKRLRPQHLRLVLALSDKGTLRAAADDLGITQPAATKALQELEGLIGASLFLRHARGVRPTAFGSAVIDFARVVLQDLGFLRDSLASIEAGDIGRVRIGAIMSSIPDLLTRAIVDLKSEHPRLQIVVQVDTSDMLMSALRQRRIDVLFGRLSNNQSNNDLVFQPISDEPLSIVTRSTLQDRIPQTGNGLSDLANRRWILQPRPSPMRHVIEQAFELQKAPFPTDVIETSSIMMTISLLLSADMLAVLPTTVAKQYHNHGLISISPIPLRARLGQYGLAWRKDQIVTSALRITIDKIYETLGQPIGCLHDEPTQAATLNPDLQPGPTRGRK